MTNLQVIRSVAKKHSLEFVGSKSHLNGARLYDFVCENTGYIVAKNWTIQSAIQEYNFGDLESKIS